MITITGPDAGAIRFIIAHLREADRRELSALGGDPAAWAAAFAELDGLTRLIWRDGAPVAVMNLSAFLPGVCWASGVATDDFPRVAITVTREIRAMFAQAFAAGARRVETRSWAGHPGRRWLKTIGFEEEVRLPGFGRGGEEFVQCAVKY